MVDLILVSKAGIGGSWRSGYPMFSLLLSTCFFVLSK